MAVVENPHHQEDTAQPVPPSLPTHILGLEALWAQLGQVRTTV